MKLNLPSSSFAHVFLLALCGTLTGCSAAEGNSTDTNEHVGTESAALTPSVTWTKVGTPWAAAKIAACGEGGNRVYALNTDRSLYVSHATGRDGTWQYMTSPTSAQQILCAGNTLYAFNDDRTLWKNIGSDTAVNWQYVGKPVAAKQITGATALAVFFPYPVFYALNDDNTFYRSQSGADDAWSYVGKLDYTTRIAAGGGVSETRPFAINTDKSFFFNSGEGCNAYWTQIGSLPYTNEIAAASTSDLYALNSDKTLWKGTINNSSSYTSVKSNGQSQRCDGTQLVTDQGNRDQACWQDTCNEGLDCINQTCRVHQCTADRTRDVNGQCVHCGSTHEIACTAGGEYGCFDVHTAPDAAGHCEFDHWCGGDGQPCCEATYLGGNCQNGLVCNFWPGDINHCARPKGGSSGGYNLCSAGQTLATYYVCVDCNGGSRYEDSSYVCSQAAATQAAQANTPACKVWDGKCR